MVLALLNAAALLLASASTAGSSPSPAPQRGPAILTYTLEAEESYAAGSPVRIRFVLSNLSDRQLFVLRWNTPIEGIEGNIFRVTHDGIEVAYRGPQIKRGEPAREDYIRIGPHESVSGVVDLAAAYDVGSAGTYGVAFAGRLLDVTRNGRALPRPREKHRPMSIGGNAVTVLVRPR